MSTEPIVLVTGATGLQGGATARHLLRAGWRVRALVRNASSPAARTLAEAGAELRTGDMDDRASLDAAMRDVHGVFSVQPTAGYPGTPPGFTVDDEIRMGLNVAEAAKDAEIDHLVYASVGGVDRSPGIRRWESKGEIENHIRTLGLPATFLRPVRFMENQANPVTGVRNGVLTDVIKPDVPVQLIAATDIGAFAALAFTDPHRYLGQALEIAGDELTFLQIVNAITRATGTPVAYNAIPLEDLTTADPDARAGYEFANNRGGWQADIPALRDLHPTLMTFETWLTREGAILFNRMLDWRR
ncbi:NmrA/HSCARG family protein [Spirillospora sp. NPDC052269]